MSIQNSNPIPVDPLSNRPALDGNAAAAAKRPWANGREKRALFSALGFLLPNLLGFLGFTLFPVLFSFGMAFTNWSPKPAIHFEFVGLRNFTDLLGVRPVDQAHPALLAAYLCCAVAAGCGLVGGLWANMAQWRGIRPGGVLITLGGLACLILAATGGGQGLAIGGAVAVLGGLSFASREGDWTFGLGTLPSLLLVGGVGGLMLLSAPMGHAYEPRDPYFWQFFYNTVYLMVGIPLSIGGSLALALLLHEELPTGQVRQRIIGAAICLLIGLAMSIVLWRAINPNIGLLCGLLWVIAALGVGFNVVVFRTLFYLPTFTAGVALMILWKALYNPKTGPINVGLAALFHVLGWHITPPSWLTDIGWAKPALIAMGVWTGIGGTNMLLYLAGLANVPKELYEAAEMDGASTWHRFRHVTWPQLAPTTFFITIMAVIGGFQGGFEQARVMTTGGPAGSTTTLSYYIYNKAFQDLDMGYASAISWILFAIVFIATALNWKFGKGLEVD